MILAEEMVLTYDELASAFGVTRKSARQLVSRKRWSRSKDRNGRARIHVPWGELNGAHAPDSTPDQASAILALTRRIEDLEQDLATAILERDEARARATDLAIRAVQADRLREMVEAERRAAEQRAQRGFWARLWRS